mgnify:CR=1 FL=1
MRLRLDSKVARSRVTKGGDCASLLLGERLFTSEYIQENSY